MEKNIPKLYSKEQKARTLASVPLSQRRQPTGVVSFLLDPPSQLKLASKMVAELTYHLGECNSAEDSDSLKDDFSF